MTEVLQQTNKTVESLVEQEVRTFSFDTQQAKLLHTFSEELAAMGGPQAAGAKSKASLAATELKFSFSKDQCELLGAYSDGLVSLLIFEGMQTFTETSPPDELPELAALENRHDVLCLAARNQILLKLVDNSSFAYDMDNEGKLVRLVANFKGGGLTKINDEPEIKELSSHSGLALGPHTEAPYWCAVNAQDGHSPSPSSLILSALWNPSLEPTSVIPLPPCWMKSASPDASHSQRAASSSPAATLSSVARARMAVMFRFWSSMTTSDSPRDSTRTVFRSTTTPRTLSKRRTPRFAKAWVKQHRCNTH
ncbi:hypothetical protein RCC30_01025 [Pseudomonas fluorescens]|nr:hypothetical protein RCC30_01025 [Pseudomonas fluorescens]